MIRRTDARQLQHVWRAEGACAHDDLAVGERLLYTSAMAVLDTDRTSVADDHPAYLGLGDHRQILLAFEVAARRAPALTAVDGGGSDRRTVEFGSADVVVGSRHLPHEPRRRSTVDSSSGYGTRPTRIGPCSIRANTGATSFQRPAGQLPAVVVEVAALDPHHPVHRAGAAEHPTGVLKAIRRSAQPGSGSVSYAQSNEVPHCRMPASGARTVSFRSEPPASINRTWPKTRRPTARRPRNRRNRPRPR